MIFISKHIDYMKLRTQCYVNIRFYTELKCHVRCKVIKNINYKFNRFINVGRIFLFVYNRIFLDFDSNYQE